MENWNKTKWRPCSKKIQFIILLLLSIAFVFMGYRLTIGIDCTLGECSFQSNTFIRIYQPTYSQQTTATSASTSNLSRNTNVKDSFNHTAVSENVFTSRKYKYLPIRPTHEDVFNVFNLPNLTKDYNQTVTSSKFSTYELLNKAQVGKYLSVKIIARDGLNRIKNSGGDFWMAVLDSPNKLVHASTSASVHDHQNGTYTVDLFVGWTGAVQVHITLVHPSRAVKVLDAIRSISYSSRVFWNGTFINSRNQSAHSLCYMDYRGPNSWQGKCPYHNRKALGDNISWVCEKPPANFTCSSLKQYSTQSVMIGQSSQSIGNSCNCIWLFTRPHYLQKLNRGPKIVKMEMDPGTQTSIKKIVSSLPTCQSNNQSGDGFWKNKVWTSLVCKTKHWYKAGTRAIAECLTNKNVYFLGDSTTRQWTFQLLTLLDATVSKDKIKRHFSYIFKYNRYFSHYNLNITFQFYPHILGSKPVLIKYEMYEVDVIDSMRDKDCNYVVIISPWAHFAQWWEGAYKERLRLIRAAVERLQTRCPGVPVILKSPHVRNHKGPFSQLTSSDYILYQIKKTMEEVFRNAAIFYINIWEMNVAYPGEKTIHMPTEVVNQELSILLSYICSDKGSNEKKKSL